MNCTKITTDRPGQLVYKILAYNVDFKSLHFDLLGSKSYVWRPQIWVPFTNALLFYCTSHTPIPQMAAQMLSRVIWALLKLLVYNVHYSTVAYAYPGTLCRHKLCGGGSSRSRPLFTWFTVGRQSMMLKSSWALPWSSVGTWIQSASINIWYRELVHRGSGSSRR